MKLTKTAIDHMRFEGKSPAARDLRWDSEVTGFGIRIWPSGKKTFFFAYRHRGRQRYLTLGPFGVLTLQQARDMAITAKVRVLHGGDPLDDKQKRDHGKTFGDLAAAYLTRHAGKKASARDDRSMLEQYVLPKWKTRPLSTIRRQDVASLHHSVSEEAPIRANRVLSLLSVMFNLATAWGFLPETALNPTRGVTRNKENQRERFVSPAEMERLLLAIDSYHDIFVRAAFWGYLLTGLRKLELLRIKWSDIDFQRREITIRKTKVGREHLIPLTSHMEVVLKTLTRLAGNPYVFCGRIRGKHLVELKNPWKEIRKAAGLPGVWIHDLRRTVATWLAHGGASLPLIGKTLNHTNTSTTQRYARYQLEGVTDALEAHGTKLHLVLVKAQKEAQDDASPPGGKAAESG